MSLAELVIISVTVEGRTRSEVARDYKISRYWVQQLVPRYELEGETAFTPRSRRPHHNPRAIGLDLEDQIVRLRKSSPNKAWTPAPKPSAATWKVRELPGSRRSRRAGGS